ncbi:MULTISPECIES: flagellar basal body rod protein FlgG [Paenibacillus]|uniref:Flagellar hook protein FlgE n=1 Tax=Paenibacillus taichungensis TaxID=484184 RepID=A0ABX2MI56_9BACL|nr:MULTISPECIES: flagellar basal body rod protein FlgG [Paenibacillus]NUU54026.1 flagellar hook-basal body complex protein [Paenibacillus taichungensis]PIH61255.1 flagellar basal body rod protein FlgG [Paenibacillus sp. LK1]WDQ30062.1 flagellar basal body rod protein FlgG [Paenibacillus marchantiae]SEA25370.1 flagellar hook protein FlgE [Paenibacillus sp. 276b]SEK21406.1 flagellar hook protein FlgE [Paenibacillus sp. OK003]
MLKSMYSGVSGMRGFQTKLDVIGNNIANVNTVGFKGSRVMFKDIMSQTTAGVTAPGDDNGGVNAKQIGLGVSVGSIDTLHLAGSPMTTNNPTDLRLNGDGFFLVTLGGEQEVPFLTRAGDFHVDANRNLVTSDGLFVVDSGGEPITLDEAVVSFTIGQDGIINQTMDDGTTEAGAQLGIGKVTNPEGLEKIGGNLYRITANANADGEFEIVTANSTEFGTGSVIAGQLEMSNVDLTGEFTEMIVAQRGFQANSRIITTSDEVLQEVVNLKR